MPADTAFMEKLTALCKRRGFIFPSSEIYGGIGGFWDYGPMGVELKRNIKQAWWQDMVINPPNGPDGQQVTMVGLDCSIIMNPKVWEASGHVGGFADPMVACKAEGCKRLFRADQLFVVELITDAALKDTGRTIGQLQRLKREFKGTVSPEETDELERLRQQLTGKGFATAPLKSLICSSTEEAEELAVLSPRERRVYKIKADEVVLPQAHPFTGFLRRADVPCPECFTKGSLTEPRQFNLMFESHAGALQDAASKVYLRPETAQGIFANYKNVLDTSRVKLPFGIAQIGKAFRNEINPRNYTFRSREFEQMEIEFFCAGTEAPGSAGTQARRHEGTEGSAVVSPAVGDMDWYQFWRNTRFDWYVHLGLKSEKLRLRDQSADELAHYSSACADIEYLFPFSDEFQELEGCAHRGCYDLSQHQKHSGRDLGYFDDELWQRDAATYKDDKNAAKEAKSKPPYKFIPTVIEPSAGADRATLAFLCEAYTEDQAPTDKGQMETRVVMKFHPRLAPIKAAFLPLINKLGLPELAQKMCRAAKQRFNAFYDDGGAIGRRYRRQDEAGTPFCVTFDGETVEEGHANKDTVTIRDRDTLKQQRVHVDRVLDWLQERLA